MMMTGVANEEFSITPSDLTCPGCNGKGSISFTLLRYYTHFCGIPFSPDDGPPNGVFECQDCGMTTDEAHMPIEVHQVYRRLLKEKKTPIHHYSGLLIFVLLLLSGMIWAQF